MNLIRDKAEAKGIELDQRLLTVQLRHPLRRVLISSYTDSLPHEQLVLGGYHGFLTKPVDPELLYTTLLRWLPDRSADAADQARPDLSRFPELCAELDELLSGDDMAAQNLYRDHEAIFTAGLGTTAKTIQHQINEFAYDEALVTLRACLTTEY